MLWYGRLVFNLERFCILWGREAIKSKLPTLMRIRGAAAGGTYHPINVKTRFLCYDIHDGCLFHSKKENGMNTNPFDFQVRREDFENLPELTVEFDPDYILSLAAKQREETAKKKKRSWLAAVGSWFVRVGRRIQHRAYPHFAGKRMVSRPVHIHGHRRRG